jgi:flagellar motor protein MotB
MMMNRSWMMAPVAALVGLMLTAGGCAATPNESPLETQNAALQRQLDQQRAAANQARAETLALQQQLAAARQQAATQANRATGLEGLAGVHQQTNARGEQTIQLEGDVLFDSGSARIKPQFKPTLDRIAQVLTQQYPGDTFRIEGYTDIQPIRHSTTAWKDNWDLGAGRARAVALYLIDQGVPRTQVYIASFADNNPVSATDLQQNRRVEIVVLPQPKQ